MLGSMYTFVVLCCVVLRAGQPRVSTGFCPSCPPLCLCRPVSLSLCVLFSPQCLFSHMFFFRFEFFVLFLFLFISVSASLVPLSLSSFLLHLLSCPVLSCSDAFVTVFVFLPLFVFPLCLFVLFCPDPCHPSLHLVLYRFRLTVLFVLFGPFVFFPLLSSHSSRLFPPPVQRVLKSPLFLSFYFEFIFLSL